MDGSAHQILVEINDNVGSRISFKIPPVEFIIPPVAGHFIHLSYDGWSEPEIAIVKTIHQICGGTSRCVIVHCSITCPDYDKLLQLFDKFKDSLPITGVSGATLPPDYYLVYRLISKLWGSRFYNPETDSPAIIGGLFRVALQLATDKLDQRYVESIHSIIIMYKKTLKNEPLDLLWLARRWDDETKMASSISRLDKDVVATAAKTYFANMKSIDKSRLPPLLRM